MYVCGWLVQVFAVFWVGAPSRTYLPHASVCIVDFLGRASPRFFHCFPSPPAPKRTRLRGVSYNLSRLTRQDGETHGAPSGTSPGGVYIRQIEERINCTQEKDELN